MIIEYRHGCIDYDLRIDGHNAYDLTPAQLLDVLTEATERGLLPDTTRLCSVIERLVEDYGVCVSRRYCEQCGDTAEMDRLIINTKLEDSINIKQQ